MASPVVSLTCTFGTVGNSRPKYQTYKCATQLKPNRIPGPWLIKTPTLFFIT